MSCVYLSFVQKDKLLLINEFKLLIFINNYGDTGYLFKV